jgi:hypothetical protein
VEVNELRNYGVAASDAEASWSDELRTKVQRASKDVVFGSLRFTEKLRFVFALAREYRRMRAVDLSALRARGMTNEAFLTQQLQYLATYAALRKVKGQDEALRVLHAVMDATAKEALLSSLPTHEEMRRFADPLEALGQCLLAMPEAASKAGCHQISVVEGGPDAKGFDVHWCVWLELARTVGVPEACGPNCYADDLAYPEYFAALGIQYRRTGTLALGQRCCDFRFERIAKG